VLNFLQPYKIIKKRRLGNKTTVGFGLSGAVPRSEPRGRIAELPDGRRARCWTGGQTLPRSVVAGKMPTIIVRQAYFCGRKIAGFPVGRGEMPLCPKGGSYLASKLAGELCNTVLQVGEK